MAADGSLKFDTKIDTTDFDKSVSTLEKALDRLAQSVDRLAGKIANGFYGAADAVENTGSKAEKTAKGVEKIEDAARNAREEAEALQKQMDRIQVHQYDPGESTDVGPEEPRIGHAPGEFEDLGAKAREFVDNYGTSMEIAEQHTNEFKQEINTLEAKLKELESQGMYFGDEEYDEAYLKLAKVKQALADYKKEMLSPTPDAIIFPADSLMGKISQLKKELAELNAQKKTFGDETYDRTYQALAQAENELAAYKKSLLDADQGQKQVNKSAKRMSSSLNKVGKSAKGAGKKLTMFGMLGRSILLSYVYRAISMVTTAVKEGFDNLAQYSGNVNATLSGLSSSLLYLKNSFAVGFAPILDFVVPALNTLINTIATALAWIAQLYAALTGKATFVKAKKTQEDYAASLKKTGGAAKQAGKDAERSTASFDKLNVISQKGSGGSGGGGGGGTTDPSEMFETVAVESDMKNLASEIHDIFSKLFQPLKNAWESEGDLTIQAAQYALSSLGTLAKDIGASMMEVWTNGTGEQMAERILEIFQGILNTVGNLATGLNEAWNQNSAGTQIVQNIANIFLSILDFINTIVQATANWAASLNFYPLLEGISRLLAAINPVVQAIGNFLSSIYQNIILPMLTFLIEQVIPFVLNGLSRVFELLSSNQGVVDGIGAALIGAFAAKKLAPFVTMIVNIIGKVKGFVTLLSGAGGLSAAMGAVTAKIGTVVAALGGPLTIAIGAAVAALVLIITHWDEVKAVMEKVAGWIATAFATDWTECFGIFGEVVNTFFSSISSVFDSVKEILSGIITFISGVFSGDWKKAWTGIKDILKSVWDLIVAVVKAPINTIISLINGMIGAIQNGLNGVINGLNGLLSKIPDEIPIVGGLQFPSVSIPKIPYLASGTVVPPRAGEFAAILGDNNREAEVVSPISAMKQAFKEAMTEMGGDGGDIRLTVNLDGKVIYDDIVKRNRRMKKQIGKNPLLA